ncbi:hypothetical protein [Bradyrhizobium japonicum]|nr:hypothetical protein [Bradyrhizobium japonicum]
MAHRHSILLTASKAEASSFLLTFFHSMTEMSKTDLRDRVFAAADGLFLRSGSLHSFGYREVRKLAKGASNDVMALFNEWKTSREQMRQSRPTALAAAADELAGTLWLIAQLLSDGRGPGAPRIEPAGPNTAPSDRGHGPRSRALQSAAAGGPARSDRSAPPPPVARTSPATFSSIPRPGSEAKPPARRRKTSKAPSAGRKASKAPSAGKDANQFVLSPPRSAVKGVELSENDWKGARDPRMAEAVAIALRKNGTRMRARQIYKALPPSNRPNDEAHAVRDLQRALAGCKIKWFKGGWFWFEDEEALPREKNRRRKTNVAKSYRRGDELWWRIAHSIVRLGRPFTPDEIADATVKERDGFAESWLRVRLIRATKGKDPFLREKGPGILEWTGLDPSHVVKNV